MKAGVTALWMVAATAAGTAGLLTLHPFDAARMKLDRAFASTLR